jgi:hypothetical protein
VEAQQYNMRTFGLFLAALGIAQAPLCAQLPAITNQPARRALWAGGYVTFAVAVSGAGPSIYHPRASFGAE